MKVSISFSLIKIFNSDSEGPLIEKLKSGAS